MSQQTISPREAKITDLGTERILTLVDLLQISWRRRFILMPVAVLVSIGLFIVLLRQTPMFEAEASLAIDRGRKAVRFAEAEDQGRIEYSLLNTYRDIILSRQVLEATLDYSGVRNEPPFSQTTDQIAAFANRVSVGTSRDSWVIDVRVRDEDAQRAERLTAVLVDRFLDQQNKRQIKRAEGALSFLSAQVTAARERLAVSRLAESDFREAFSLSSTDGEDNIFTETIAQLTSARLAIERRLSEQETLISQGSEQMLDLREVNGDEIVTEARKRILELRERQVELGQRFLVKHPRMIEISAQIAQAEAELQRAAEVAWASIGAKARSLATQRDVLSQRIAEEEKKLAVFRRNLAKLNALEQESLSHERLLEQLLTRLGEEEVASRLEGGQVTVIDPARAGDKPVNIRPALFVAGSLFAGLIAGLGMVFLAEYRDRRVRGVEGIVEATQLPVLVRIPDCPDLEPLGGAGDPRHPAGLADAVRVLRSAMGFQAGMDPKVMVVSSSRAGEGKSTVTSRLAVSAAAAGLNVLLVDTDLRKPTQHVQFGIEMDQGLSTVLSSGAEAEFHETAYGSLQVIVAGKSEQINPEALSTPQMRELIATWKSQFDLVLIDTPPLGIVADALPICEMADHIVLVVRDRLVTKGALANAQHRLRPFGERIAGIVMNGEKEYGKDEYGYGYGYGYGYDLPKDS